MALEQTTADIAAGDVAPGVVRTEQPQPEPTVAAAELTVPETARQLHKGAETVKTQRNKIILKIGARNMTHAVCIAAERGIVSAAAA